MKKECPHTQRNAGFTLIELSIVLVIIGLIVGGVLVGQDLIKAAQIRAAISQIEKTDAAVNTFRTKYNGLPGDVASATNFFPAAADSPLLANCANYNAGNGVFDDCGGTKVTFGGEPTAFWHHLYLASLIGDAMTDTNLIGGAAAPSAPASNALAFPASKIGSGNFVFVYTGASTLVEPGMAGVNMYRVAGIGAAFTAAGAPTFANSLTPLEAFALDSKKDDGIPNTGVVQATDTITPATFNVAGDTVTVGAGKCVAVAGAYNSGGAPNTRVCQVMMRTSF